MTTSNSLKLILLLRSAFLVLAITCILSFASVIIFPNQIQAARAVFVGKDRVNRCNTNRKNKLSIQNKQDEIKALLKKSYPFYTDEFIGDDEPHYSLLVMPSCGMCKRIKPEMIRYLKARFENTDGVNKDDKSIFIKVVCRNKYNLSAQKGTGVIYAMQSIGFTPAFVYHPKGRNNNEFEIYDWYTGRYTKSSLDSFTLRA
jgi:hypothetical protein